MNLSYFARSFLGKKICYSFWDKMYHLSLQGMNIGGGGEPVSSGEGNVLNYILKKERGKSIVIYDCGANKGQYTLNVLNHAESFPAHIEIHAFEPGKSTFSDLEANVKQRRNVFCHNFALSDTVSSEMLYYDEKGSGLASLHKRQLDYLGINFNRGEMVNVKTLDYFYENSGFSHDINLLKMDIEGNELKALKGAEKLLERRKIKAIQIEFGGCNIDSRTYIRDFWSLLSKDFIMYRVLRDGFASIKRYDESLEMFSCSNYFFELK